jgi:hypothetical protein
MEIQVKEMQFDQSEEGVAGAKFRSFIKHLSWHPVEVHPHNVTALLAL